VELTKFLIELFFNPPINFKIPEIQNSSP
jgi:hypothetical protein